MYYPLKDPQEVNQLLKDAGMTEIDVDKPNCLLCGLFDDCEPVLFLIGIAMDEPDEVSKIVGSPEGLGDTPDGKAQTNFVKHMIDNHDAYEFLREGEVTSTTKVIL